MTIDTNYLTVKEAAEALGISEQTVKRRIKAGELKADKMPLPGKGRYMLAIRRESLAQATQIVEVVHTTRPVDIAEFQKGITDALAAENASLRAELVEMKNQMVSMQAILSQMNEKIIRLTEQPPQLAEATKENPPQQKLWWKFWA